MAIPENRLSTQAIPAAFIGSRGVSTDPLIDYEDGGIDFNDPSKGHYYQWWKAYVQDNQIWLGARDVEAQVMYSGTNVTEISLAFDQNMRPCLAFIDDGVAYLQWYDPVAQAQVLTPLGSDVITPKVTLDDKRVSQNSTSDIIVAYIKSGSLMYRQQRDRFTIEYDITEPVPEPERSAYRAKIAESPGLIRIGMGSNLRLMFQLKTPFVFPSMPPECSIDGDVIWPEWPDQPTT